MVFVSVAELLLASRLTTAPEVAMEAVLTSVPVADAGTAQAIV